MANQFDELSKALAAGISRREALRRIGSGLVGATLAALGLGKADAAPNPCSVFCSKNFPPGPARAACLQACRQCGADVSRVCFGATNAICCAPDSSCCNSSTGSAFCCPEHGNCCGDGCCSAGQNCCLGSSGFFCCEGECCGDNCCGPGTFCQDGQCIPQGTCLSETICGQSFSICGQGAGGLVCICTRSVEGDVACGNDFPCNTPSCTSSAECEELLGPGFYCQAEGTGCCGQVCVPPCGTTTLAAGTTTTGRTNSGT